VKNTANRHVMNGGYFFDRHTSKGGVFMKKNMTRLIVFLAIAGLLMVPGWKCNIGPQPADPGVEEPVTEEPPAPEPDAEDQPPPEPEPEEASPPDKDELSEGGLDPVGDAASCFNYEVFGIKEWDYDLQEIGAEFDPKTNEFKFFQRLVLLSAVLGPGHGGIGFWVEGTPRDEDSEWGPDRLANNYINYMINEDGSVEFSRSQFTDQAIGWEEVLDTNVTGEIKDGVVFFTVSGIEFIPKDFDPETGKIYMVAVTFNGDFCDFWGQGENDEPDFQLDLKAWLDF